MTIARAPKFKCQSNGNAAHVRSAGPRAVTAGAEYGSRGYIEAYNPDASSVVRNTLPS
jgi:hypothetical protein